MYSDRYKSLFSTMSLSDRAFDITKGEYATCFTLYHVILMRFCGTTNSSFPTFSNRSCWVLDISIDSHLSKIVNTSLQLQ